MSEVVAAPIPEVVLGADAESDDSNVAQKPAAQAVAEKADQSQAKDSQANDKAPADEADTPDPAQKKGQARFERRINRLHRERAEAIARAELAERMLNESKQQAAAPKQDGRPKFEDFNYDPDKYAQAVAEYERGRVETEFKSRQQREAQAAQNRAMAEAWEKKADRGGDKYDDFDVVVGDLKPTAPWSAAVINAENGDDVAYHLGKNMAEAQRIAALDPVSQILEIGRLSAKLAATPPQKPLSKAPKPIEPLSGASSGVKGEPDAKDTAAWIKWRSAQVHGKKAA